jgi:hypothetical protein
MPSKSLVAAAVFVWFGLGALPVKAQTPGPESTQPQTMAPEATAPEATAPESRDGPSHRITGAAVLFNLIDFDRDGAISQEEAGKLFDAVFTTLDADDDGKLSKDEINSALWKMREGRTGHGYRHRDEEDYEGNDG